MKMENQDYEFKIGDIVVVDELHYQYKQYNFLKSGMVGKVVDVLNTNNIHNWQRLEILLLVTPFVNIKLYSVEIKLCSEKEKCNMMLSKDIKTNEILGCFEHKVSESIDSYFDDLESDIIDNDMVQQVMRVSAKYAQDCLEEREIDSVVEVSVHIDNDCGEGNIQSLTKESVQKLDFLTEQHNKALENLQEFIKEVNSVLCMCDSFEQSVQVLRDYGIVEKKKIKVVSDFDFKVFCRDVV